MEFLIVGLGNPGKKYEKTRHNAGFLALDHVAKEFDAGNFSSSKQADALCANVTVSGRRGKLVKPHTFMNKSGEAVRSLVEYFGINPERVLVIYDDVDLPLGTIRVAKNRGAGGHNGIKSVINELGTKAFSRIRIGIAPTDESGEVDKPSYEKKGINPFVMGKFTKDENEVLEKVFPKIKKASELWVKDGAEAAANQIN